MSYEIYITPLYKYTFKEPAKLSKQRTGLFSEGHLFNFEEVNKVIDLGDRIVGKQKNCRNQTTRVRINRVRRTRYALLFKCAAVLRILNSFPEIYILIFTWLKLILCQLDKYSVSVKVD